MEKAKYHEMLPHEILARRRRFPAAFVGLGGLEWHGDHLAVGNDALKAERLCELAATESGGFAFPTLWYGEPRATGLLEADFDETGEVKAKMKLKADRFTRDFWGQHGQDQERFYQSLLSHLLVQLYTLEMKAICLLCGHYPLHGWALPVVEDFNSRFDDCKAYAGIEFHFAENNPDVGGDHAAKWETSYLMYLRPECVDMSMYVGKGDEPLLGVVGDDPRVEASKEIGRKASALIVEGMVRKANDLLQQAKFID